LSLSCTRLFARNVFAFLLLEFQRPFVTAWVASGEYGRAVLAHDAAGGAAPQDGVVGRLAVEEALRNVLLDPADACEVHVEFSNSALSFVELEMKAGGLLDLGVEVKNRDFAALAQSAGLLGLKAETAQDVRPMLQQALKHDGPALVEVLVHRQELSMPPTIKLEQATGFGLFMLKAVIGGRGDELVDLAKVNLFR